MEQPRFIKRLKAKLRWKKVELRKLSDQLSALHDLTLFHHAKQAQAQAANPLSAFGRKCFSQTDEDGITLEILRRIGGLSDGAYAEFGVGDGMENNTLILAALGWSGFWVGGETLRPSIKNSTHFTYLQRWITAENILEFAAEGLKSIKRSSLDAISLDLDGNDIYLVEALLSHGLHPKLFIVEYNGKFPPPVEFQIPYNPQHVWKTDDYFGASLSSFAKLFAKFDYKLVCCNAHTGANAFFVHNKYAQSFADVPADIGSLFVEPRYWLYQRHGTNGSVKTVEQILNRS